MCADDTWMFIFKNDILNALGKPVAAQENDTNNETTISHKKRKFAKICTTQKWLCYGRKQKINRHFLSVLLWVINAHKPSRFFVRFLLKVYSCIRFSLYWQVNNIVYICFQIQKKTAENSAEYEQHQLEIRVLLRDW